MENDDTLGDLKARDIDNLSYLLKNKKVYHYDKSWQALHVAGIMLSKVLLRCGIDINKTIGQSATPEVASEMIEALLAKNNTKIEHREYDEKDEDWRSGVYVYKNNEIVAFIGKPKRNIIHGWSVTTTEPQP